MTLYTKREKPNELYIFKERFSKKLIEVYKLTRFPVSIEIEKINDLELTTLDEYLNRTSKYVSKEILEEIKNGISNNLDLIKKTQSDYIEGVN